MKFKRKILSILALGIVALGIMSINSNSYATTDSNGGLYLGLEAFRNSGYSYMAIEKIMWKISTYNRSSSKQR